MKLIHFIQAPYKERMCSCDLGQIGATAVQVD